MTRSLSIYGAAISVLVLEFFTATSSAQQIVRSKGKIDEIVPGFLKVTSDDGAWILKIAAPQDDIVLTANAESAWLRPGMLVRFEANLDDRGMAQQLINELTVFTPRKGYGIGVIRDEGFKGADNGARKRRKGKKPTDTIPELENEASNEAIDAAEANRPAFLIAGELVQRNESQLLIAAGRQRITATLGEAVTIKVDMLGDYSLAQPGDEIKFVARSVQPANQQGVGQAIASRIQIKCLQPFTAPVADALAADEKRTNTKSRRREKIDEAVKQTKDLPPSFEPGKSRP